MTTLVLPFHQDERVGDRSIVVPAEAGASLVTPTSPPPTSGNG